MVSEVANRINESPTMKVSALAKKMKADGENVINLSVGEPDFPTPENIKQAAKKAIDENQTRYTINSGTVELRKAIAAKLKRDNDLDYDIKNIIVSNGAKHSVFNCILATVNKGEEVIIPAPYWVSYPDMVSIANGTSIIIDTKEENGFKVTPEELERAITPKTKALILCNPSNPTGSAYSGTELEKVAEVCLKHNFYIISDEIYEKLTYGDYKFVSFPSLNEELKKRTLLVNGLSKAYSMTGWRIGYTAGPENVIQAINKIQSHSTSNAASISQAASKEALNGSQDAVEEMRKEFEKRRNYLYTQLVSIDGISCYKPEGAFYLFPNISVYFNKSYEETLIKDSFDFAMFILSDAKVAAVPGSAFGAEGFLRLSYATSMSNLEEAVARLKESLKKLK
ncbi:MAG: pyridoxal phosphate-dependent aminotransferase [Ignavibacteriaceae bacterium]